MGNLVKLRIARSHKKTKTTILKTLNSGSLGSRIVLKNYIFLEISDEDQRFVLILFHGVPLPRLGLEDLSSAVLFC